MKMTVVADVSGKIVASFIPHDHSSEPRDGARRVVFGRIASSKDVTSDEVEIPHELVHLLKGGNIATELHGGYRVERAENGARLLRLR